MRASRPEKNTIRDLWADIVQRAEPAAMADPDTPLYLTLAGAEGLDLQKMEDRGLLLRTESNSVVPEHQTKFVAVESSPFAVAELQQRYPGLKIIQASVQDLLRSTNLTRWPDGAHRTYCRAAVINLDLNEPLLVSKAEDQLDFPALTLVQKLSQLHAATPRKREWFLCLTLVGKIPWTSKVQNNAQLFLKENFAREPHFAEACRSLLGKSVFDVVTGETPRSFSGLTANDQQRILMGFVPKKIAHLVSHQGWRVKTSTNLRYGGRRSRAPMVTWIFEFTWDVRASITPDVVYRESLRDALVDAGEILMNGSIVPNRAIAT